MYITPPLSNIQYYLKYCSGRDGPSKMKGCPHFASKELTLGP